MFTPMTKGDMIVVRNTVSIIDDCDPDGFPRAIILMRATSFGVIPKYKRCLVRDGDSPVKSAMFTAVLN